MSELTLHLNGRRVLYSRARWLSQARREKREECRRLACLDATAQLLTATTHSWLTPNIRWKGSRGSESTQALTGWRLDWCFNIWNSNLKLFECGISDLSLPDERSRQYLLIWGTTHLDETHLLVDRLKNYNIKNLTALTSGLCTWGKCLCCAYVWGCAVMCCWGIDQSSITSGISISIGEKNIISGSLLVKPLLIVSTNSSSI